MSLLGLLGSNSADVASDKVPENPLAKCPNTPNCIRISRKIPTSTDACYKASRAAIAQMNPKKIFYQPGEFRIESVFSILLFRDDFIIQITNGSKQTSILHIRSASRVGFSDFWVNKRRVKRFLNIFQKILQKHF